MTALTGACLAAASVVILLCAPAQYLGRQQDDIVYVIAAQALTRGRYSLLTTPGTPAIVDYSPGLPLALAPLALLAGDHTLYYQLFCALILAACPWALWFWLRKTKEPASALPVALLFATSPLVLSQSGTVMTEAPYTLLNLALLTWLAGEQGREHGRGSGLAPGSVLAYMTLLRSPGLSLWPALLAEPLRQKRWKESGMLLAAPCLAVVSWLAWCRWNRSYSPDMAEWSLTYRGQDAGQFFRVAASNLRFYMISLGSCFLPDFWGGATAGLLAGCAVAAAAFAGAVKSLRRDPAHPAVIMLGTASLMHIFWGWQYERYLLPLLPLVLAFMALGLGKAWRIVCLTLLMAQTVFHVPHWVSGSSWKHPELAQTYDWIKNHTGPGDILSSPLYVRDAFYTGRPSVPLPDRPDSSTFADSLKSHKTRRVLWQERLEVGLSREKGSPISEKLDRVGNHLLDTSRFRLVFEHPGEDARIYEVR